MTVCLGLLKNCEITARQIKFEKKKNQQVEREKGTDGREGTMIEAWYAEGQFVRLSEYLK
jgi:hypothetical protein